MAAAALAYLCAVSPAHAQNGEPPPAPEPETHASNQELTADEYGPEWPFMSSTARLYCEPDGAVSVQIAAGARRGVNAAGEARHGVLDRDVLRAGVTGDEIAALIGHGLSLC